MNPIILEENIVIPPWVNDFDAFRRWTHDEAFPDHGWFSHLAGDLWVDLSRERVGHNQIRGEVAIVVGTLTKAGKLGRFFHDRMRLVHAEAALSTEPDGMFVSNQSFETLRVQLAEGDKALEVIGSADMVVEVISQTSVRKDTKVLRELYWAAGILEYWLIDSRGTLSFDILRRTAKGYSATRKEDGWIKSGVFGKSFKLTQEQGSISTEFSLLVR